MSYENARKYSFSHELVGFKNDCKQFLFEVFALFILFQC